MRYLLAVLIGVLILGVAPRVCAEVDWEGIALPTWQHRLTAEWFDPGAEEPLDGCNLEPRQVYVTRYVAPHWKFVYHPIHDFWVERVEIIAGGAVGKVQFEILEGNGRGGPSGFALASGMFVQLEKHSWQGADLTPSVLLLKGHEYHLKCTLVPGGFISSAAAGEEIPDLFSYDGMVWVGPRTRLPWSIRFFGHLDPSATETTTWGSVKNLYR